MKKKITPILLTVIVLLSSVLSACNGSNGSVAQTTTNGEGTNTANPVNFKTWVTYGIDKVEGGSNAPRNPSTEIDVFMAKNEKESFHIALKADADVSGLKIVIDEGSRDDISVEFFKEHLIKTNTSYYPDPIVPITDTFGLSNGMNECVLVRFTTSESTEAGDYVYKFSVLDEKGNSIGSYTAKLKVWDFALPENYSTDTSTGLYLDYIRSKEKIPARLNDKYYIAYYEMLLDYGMSAYDLPYDILSDKADAYMSDPRVTSFRVPFAVDDDKILEYYEKLKTNEVWLNKAYFLPYDEPSSVEQINELIPECERLKELAPDIRIIIPFFTNVAYDSDRDEIDMLEKYLGIWCPKAPCFQEGWLDDPLGKGYFGDRMAAQKACGDKIWWYVCWEPGFPFCNMFVNEQGLNHVTLFWQQYDNGVEGFLYWSANYWRYIDDPWTDMATVQGWLSGNVYGDGSLMYPGKKVGIEGPVASLRLECIRNGMEDVELLKLAEELLGRAWVDEMIDKVTKSVGDHTKSADVFADTRKAIGDAIEERFNDQ